VLLLAQFLALAHQHFLGFEFLSFVFKSGFSAPPKMSQDKKVVAELKGKCALGPFLSILVIECQHKCFNVNQCPRMNKVQI
jgi:hypothetical protein